MSDAEERGRNHFLGSQKELRPEWHCRTRLTRGRRAAVGRTRERRVECESSALISQIGRTEWSWR